MVILCKNTRIENGEKTVPCKRFLADIPQCAIDSLKANPGEKMIFRCATCPGYDRWISVYYNSTGGAVWESSAEKPDFTVEMNFDVVFRTEQFA
jgi:hypothetical protein